jgi:hypothetical protein
MYRNPIEYKKKGILGPYVENNTLERSINKNVIGSPQIESDKNTHVRFKDDQTNSDNNYFQTDASNPNKSEDYGNANLRNLKENLANFNKKQTSSKDAKNLPVIALGADLNTSVNSNNIAYSSAKNSSKFDMNENRGNIYSIPDTIMPQTKYSDRSNRSIQQPFQLQEPPAQESFENLYSQVAPNNKVRNSYIIRDVPENLNYDDSQPVYMNTSYNRNLDENEI